MRSSGGGVGDGVSAAAAALAARRDFGADEWGSGESNEHGR
jgi:hypothetical protein